MGFFLSSGLLWTLLYGLTFTRLVLGSLSFRSRKFTREVSCKLQERIDKGCAEPTQGNYGSIIACSLKCQGNCTGMVWEEDSRCYVYKPCQNLINCTEREFDFYRKLNPCQHNGTWDVTTDSCKCVDDWVGERCERLPVSCRELREFAYPPAPGKRRWVNLDLSTYHEPVRVQCELNDNSVKTVLMWNKGNVNNNRSWTNYVNGFFDDDNHFWLGLDKIKALNDAGLTSVLMGAGFINEDRKYTFLLRTFQDFRMSGPSAGYSFTLSPGIKFGFGPYKDLPYGDCLSPVIGAKFSTWDNDNDQASTSNCAAQAGVGWWFKDCVMTCNPLGLNYYKLSGTETIPHIKMAGVDFGAQTYAKSSDAALYFFSNF